MNIFKRLAVIGFLGMTTMTSVACGLEAALDDAQAKLAAEAKKKIAEKGFQSAVSGVTNAIIQKAMSAANGSTAATAPNFSPLAVQEDSGTFDIDETVDAEGGTITNKGKITFKSVINTDDMNPAAMSMKFDMTLDLTTTWVGMKFKDEAGKELSTDGTMVVGGEFHTDISGETFTFNGKITEKGKFTVDGTSYEVDITVLIDEKGATYTGTINGEAVSGSFASEGGPSEEPMDECTENCTAPMMLSCSLSTFECVDYTGSLATYDCSAGTEAPMACPAATVGTCTYDGATDTETNHRIYTGYESLEGPALDCTGSMGTWSSVNY